MRRLLVPLILALVACRALVSHPAVNPSSEEPSPTIFDPQPSATATPPGITGGAVEPTTAPEIFESLSEEDFAVRFHPDGTLFVGDQVSLEVIPPLEADLDGHSMQVWLSAYQEGDPLVGHFANYGIGGRSQATLHWVWDTSELSPGEYSLTFSIQPDDLTWTESVSLYPGWQAPDPEPGASWAHAESDCCLVYYITGTPAERDLPKLLAMVDEQTRSASQLLGVDLDDLEKPLLITFLPRVLGHGGFTSSEISVSYLDRNYAGQGTETILHHEIVHMLDGQLESELRPTILVEGLAVYLSGGHYKPEPLVERAAALLPPEPGCSQGGFSTGRNACGLDWYVPLESLVDDFYFEQHEIGYLEAGALVAFMVDTWGWETFSDFYHNIQPQPTTTLDEGMQAGQHYHAIDAASQVYYGVTLEALEDLFLESLREENFTAGIVWDVRLSVSFYETLRRYQELLDPSAHFLSAWLPSGERMRREGIVADFLRCPSSLENLAFETMLAAAEAHLRNGEYERAEALLAAINEVLAAYDQGSEEPFGVHTLAADYLALVRTLRLAGYNPQKIVVQGERARAWVSMSGPEVLLLNLMYAGDGWVMEQEAGFSQEGAG